jgi:hypothetical protein
VNNVNDASNGLTHHTSPMHLRLSEPGEFDFPDELMLGPVVPGFSLGGLLAPPAEPFGSGFLNLFGSGFAGKLSSDLRLKLNELPEQARASRMEELRSMTAAELERENNAAQNHFMMHGLGLGDMDKETLWGGAVVPAKRKAPAQTKPKGKKKKTWMEREVAEDSGTESESVSMSESEAEPRPAKEPTQRARIPRGAATVKSKQPNGWAVKVKGILENKDRGPLWAGLTSMWWAREEAAGFEGTVSNERRCRCLTGIY